MSSGFPTAIPALEPTLAARSTCATKDVTRWFSRWWPGSNVSTPTPKAAVVLFIQSTYKNRLSCGVAPFSYPLPLPFSLCLGCISSLIGLPFLRFHAVAFSFSYCLCDLVCVFYFFCSSRRRPSLATFLSVLFCLLFSLLISERISGLIWFGSVYLVTTAGFVADQLM